MKDLFILVTWSFNVDPKEVIKHTIQDIMQRKMKEPNKPLIKP